MIRPIDLNGMVQNTQGLSATRSHEQQQPLVQQEMTALQSENEAEISVTQVHEQDDASAEGELNPEREGSGTGYEANKRRKKKTQKKEKISDGVVTKKSAHRAFDLKI